MAEHAYALTVEWTGNNGVGTAGYREYRRDHVIRAEGRPALLASSELAFRGDPTRYNPEELLVASLSSCHMLWYLHLCATVGVHVVDYVDHVEGVMITDVDGSGRFAKVVLHPQVTVAHRIMIPGARDLHDQAHVNCFIANSVNFPVLHRPDVRAQPT